MRQSKDAIYPESQCRVVSDTGFNWRLASQTEGDHDILDELVVCYFA